MWRTWRQGKRRPRPFGTRGLISARASCGSAIAKYKESLTYWPDPGQSGHIATLEGNYKQDSDTAARKARAKQLRDEGYALQQKNQLQAAVGKYRESLAVWPDPQLEDYIRQLETKIASSSSINPDPGPARCYRVRAGQTGGPTANASFP